MEKMAESESAVGLFAAEVRLDGDRQYDGTSNPERWIAPRDTKNDEDRTKDENDRGRSAGPHTELRSRAGCRKRWLPALTARKLIPTSHA